MHLSVAPVQDALLVLIETALPGVEVGISPANIQPEHVWINGEVTELRRNYRQSGVVAADEQYELLVHLLTERADPDYLVVRDRMQALTDAVCDALAADPTLGGLAKLVVVARAQVEETFKDESTRQMMTTLTVRCDVHVT
jgi:hypothetical protein